MNKRKRYKLTLIAAVFMIATTFYAIYSGMEGVASASIGGFMTILSTYIWGETRRPSN